MRPFARNRLLACGVVAASIHGSANAAIVTALDNTGNGSATFSSSNSRISTSEWQLRVFTVGPSTATISSMTMGLYSMTANTTHAITWELYLVDGSNNPTGPLLATDTQSQLFVGAFSAAYYTFTTEGTLGSFEMTAGQTYGLLFKSSTADESLRWSADDGNTVYVGSGGFSYVANRRTTDSGSAYGDSIVYNAWQMNVSVPSAIPGGTGLAALACGAIGLRGRRRSRVA